MKHSRKFTWKAFFSICLKIFLVLDFIFCCSFFLNRTNFLLVASASLLGSVVLSILLFKCRWKKGILRVTLGVLLTVNAGMLVLTVALYGTLIPGTHYRNIQGGYLKTFFSGDDRTVMVVVPHQDDDLNVVGGIIGNYRKEGVTVKVVFASSGDAQGLGEVRMQEAIRCLATRGVPEEDIIFLGYGDLYRSPYKHLYNAPGNEIVTSWNGKTQTYGLKTHPDYRTAVSGKPSDYTRNNFVKDIKDVINEYKPGTIFCVDFDINPDHRAVSLCFEEAIASILKEESGYHPEVFKGFAYCTAWLAPNDYYALNVASSTIKNKSADSNYVPDVKPYEWDKRVRLPVLPETLAYTKRSSSYYSYLYSYESQNAISAFGKIVNSDKVFWFRRTDSLLYSAAVTASSGNSSFVNDFKLIDTDDVTNTDLEPCKNVWVPDQGDGLRSLTFTFASQPKVHSLYLYDNPSLQNNITQATITLSNGKTVQTGALNPNGSATEIDLGEETITGFTITIDQSEGDTAGLSEVEAYNTSIPTRTFVKLTSADDNFIYDYTPDSNHNILLKVYTPHYYGNKQTSLDLASDFTITTEGDENITWRIENNQILVQNPSDKPFTLKITSKSNPDLSDQIQVESSSKLRKDWIHTLQSYEKSLDWVERMYRKPYKIFVTKVLKQRFYQ